MDVVLAVLFPLTWAAPNLVYPGLFEFLVTCLTAELLELLVLFVVTKRHIADTPEQFRSDWKLARWAVLIVLSFFVLGGSLDWRVSLFIAVVVFSADYPLRIAPHPRWREQLNTDVWILYGIVMMACLFSIQLQFPPVPDLHLPVEGIVHDLVFKYHLLPQEAFSLGTFYFVPKAVLNSYRYLTNEFNWIGNK